MINKNVKKDNMSNELAIQYIRDLMQWTVDDIMITNVKNGQVISDFAVFHVRHFNLCRQ